MNEMLFETLSVALTGLAGWGMTMLRGWLKQKASDETTAHIMFIVSEVVDIAVRAVHQTKVKLYREKNGGKLTAGERESAKMEALDKAVNLLGPRGQERLKSALGMTDGAMLNMLSERIEAKVGQLKQR